jgi:choline dehydrogenase-like flavoprotein
VNDLRVVDSSINANINVPVIAIAERAVDLIR